MKKGYLTFSVIIVMTTIILIASAFAADIANEKGKIMNEPVFSNKAIQNIDKSKLNLITPVTSSPAATANSNTSYTPSPITRGEAIYKSKCQACHGVGGNAGVQGGMKTAANFANLDANPPRIKQLLIMLTIEDHKKIVRLGGSKSGVAGAGAAMPKLGLSEQDIDDVVAYERTLGAFNK